MKKIKIFKQILLAAALLLVGVSAQAQVKIGTNPSAIDPRAILHIESDTSGLYFPRLTTLQRDAQTGWKAGMAVYNTTDSCLQLFDGTKWECTAKASSLSKNYTFLRTADSLPGERLGDDTLKAFRKGHTAFGNYHPNPDLSMQFGTTSATNFRNVVSTQEYLDNSNFTPATIWAGVMPALRVRATNASAGSLVFGSNASVFTDATSTANFTAMRAVAGHAQQDGTGTLNHMYSYSGAAMVNGGTISDVVGVNNLSWNRGTAATPSIVGNLYGAVMNLSLGANSTTTNVFGYRMTNGGYVPGYALTGNSYGLYVDNMPAPTSGTGNDWGVYQADTSDFNYFAGNSSIGNAVTNPNSSNIRLFGANDWNNILNVNTNLTNYSKLVNNGVYAGMSLKNSSTAATGFYDGFHTDIFSDPASTQNFFWINSANLYLKHQGSGTVTTAMGAWTPLESSGSGTITNGYGYRTQLYTTGTSGARITNGYGLYVEPFSGNVTNKWSIYTNNGRASIGDTLQLRTVPTGTATDEILVRRATTGDVYKISADSIGAKTEPWFNTNTLTGSTKVTDTIYHTGHAAMGNAFTTPDTSLNYATGTTKVQNITASQEILDDANFTANALWAAHMPSLRVTATTTAANRSIFGTNSSVFTAPTSTANISAMRAVASHAQHDGTGTISGMIGLSSAAIGGGGTVTDLRSGNFSARNAGTVASPSIVGTLYGVNAQLILSANSTTTNFYGYATAGSSYAAGYALTGNSYGLHISNMPAVTSGAGRDWGVYQADTSDDNYFAGHTNVGNFSPKADTSYFFPTLPHSNILAVQENVTAAQLAKEVVNGSLTELNVTSALTSGTARLRGQQARVVLNGGFGSTNNIYGNFGEVDLQNNGNTSNVVAAGNFITADISGTGVRSQLYGVKTVMNTLNAASTVTNSYGFHYTSGGTGTNVANGYGLYVDNVNATNKWSIYTNSGRASIGDTLQLRTVPTGSAATDEILVRRTATGDVYKVSPTDIVSASIVKGRVACTGATTQTIANTNVTATSTIILTYEDAGAVISTTLQSRAAGASFTVQFASVPPTSSFINYIIMP